MRWVVAAGIGTVAAGTAQAGETPLYQPAPDWVKPAPPITAAQVAPSAPLTIVRDNQERLQDGQVWSYDDRASRISSPETLSRNGTLTIPWQPAHGDLIVHRVEIIRGGEHIDMLAGNKRFTVIRREQKLERQEVNGVLTATMPIEGLRIGDILHVTLSITRRDTALNGRLNTVRMLPVAPFRVGYVRNRLLWPAFDPVQWKSYAEGVQPVITTSGGYRELVIEGVLPKQPEMPKDAPARYARPPLIEASSFPDWASVAAIMAPLYATTGLIAPGSPLAAEVARIRAADTDPLRRAAAALSLVQDQVRYLFNGMNGGNYRPQSPTQTWTMRYGDCKAKTLLLLSLLHALDIEAEAVLAPVQNKDVFTGRLPTPAAFDHVLVRATIGGDTLWLDGTRTGTRLADIRDVPSFRTVLPLRMTGATLSPVPFRADVRPDLELTLDLDQGAGVTLPTLMTATVKMRGPMASMLGVAAEQAAPEQRRALVGGFVNGLVGNAVIATDTIGYDRESGIATITAKGILPAKWPEDRERRRLTLDRLAGSIDFQPDRGRPAWRDIPVSLGDAQRRIIHTRLRLPQGGRGFTLDGDRTLDDIIAGRSVRREAKLAGDMVTIDEEGVSMTPEIAPADIAAARARLALAKARALEVIAPADLPSAYAATMTTRKNGGLKPMLALFGEAITADPDKKRPYLDRATFEVDVYDHAAAIADLGKALAIDPDAMSHLWRAHLYEQTGDRVKQRADLDQALALDPVNRRAITGLGKWLVDAGRTDEALAMVQERIDDGGREAPGFLSAKADILARAGRPDEVIAAIDQAVADSPGTAPLLNQRCWLKGTLNIRIDTALADCSRSIELGGDKNKAALDSRAMVYFRMNRFDDALVDLAGALDGPSPQAGSLYMRGVILTRQGKAAAAADDLAAARAMWPLIDREYGRWGIKP